MTDDYTPPEGKTPMDESGAPRCGTVAIIGRPNVGKSTLLNHILGQKLSITSRKPQTTRHQIIGIKTEGNAQAIYVDTPGMHREEPRALNRYMNRTATSALRDVDLVVFVVDRDIWTDGDENVLNKLTHLECPVLLAINKVDLLEDKTALLPHLEFLGKQRQFADIIPLSALRNRYLDVLEERVTHYLPEGVHHYPEEQFTNRSERFLAAELVREKITRQLGAELPYSMTVEIETFKRQGDVLHINALILVEREGQKKIVIGDRGSRLKLIGQEARLDMEPLFDSKVMLQLWVKVKRGWADDERALRSLGFD
ncbi:MAG: GTPase Era [Halomonadaceae bacterium]|nr:MAG: GTPase Era [Halomonadaceae bacterium]